MIRCHYIDKDEHHDFFGSSTAHRECLLGLFVVCFWHLIERLEPKKMTWSQTKQADYDNYSYDVLIIVLILWEHCKKDMVSKSQQHMF